jgi:ABC-type sugar transport system permease subunit
MSTRTLIEALVLSIGVIACAVSAFAWATSADWETIQTSLSDDRLWNAVRASLEIGIVAGGVLAGATLIVPAMYLYGERTPSRLIVVLALAIALTPDLVHALVWRAALQPNVAPQLFQTLLADPEIQCVILGLVLAIKWAPLVIVVAASVLDERRIKLRRMLVLAGVSKMLAFYRSALPHLARWACIALVLGVLVGLRQHELSDSLLAGGAGFGAEGLSQWVSKVALAFLDPGRAAAELLLILVLVTLVGAVLTSIAGRSRSGVT